MPARSAAASIAGRRRSRWEDVASAANADALGLIGRQTRDDASKAGLRVATMHRVKCLEFDRVIVAGANADLLPFASAFTRASSTAAREDLEHQERARLTLARHEVLITSHGTAGTWLATRKV